MFARLRIFLLLELLCLLTTVSGIAQVSVLTQHNDVARTGQNINEATLNTSNVNVSGFGKLFWRTIDGQVYAQPLYVPNLVVGGKTRNVVYVATQHNSVYAFDADDPTAAAPLWHVNLGTPVPSQDICIISGDTDPRDCPYLDINPEIGITSTPVIDSNAGIIYVVARTKSSNSTYHFFLHALDIKAGSEQFGGPMEITGQVSGSGTGSSGGILVFNPTFHLQRPSLLLLNGVVYVAFGAVGDIGTFHGWIMGYNATTLQQTTILCITPNGSDGGIWESGQGIVSDGVNDIYVMTGNGTFDANVSGGKDYGDSVLQITTSSGLAVNDYFTPSNQALLFEHDTDLGSGGPLLLPGTSLLTGIGKDKLLRLVSTTSLGKFNSGFDGDVQEFTATLNAYLGSPVYWDSPNNGPVVYLWSPADFLTAYKLVGGMFQTTPATQSTIQNSTGFANTAPLSVSANGGLVGSGIVWAGGSFSGSASGVSAPGVLRAFDATNLGSELWDSMQNPARDDVGLYAKWVPPTIVNGKVYLPNFSGQLLVYGLNPPPASGIRFVQSASTTPGTATASVSASYSSAQTAGDLNVVVVSWADATSTIQSVTDSQGHPYSLAIGPTTGTALRQSVYYLKNIAGGTNSVTVAFNQAAASPDLRILEYSGVDTVSPFDVSVGATGSSSTADSGPIALTNANDLIIGANIVSTKNIVAGAPFTSRLQTGTTANIVEDRVVNVAASYDAWTPLLSSGPWVMQLVAFKARSTSSNPPPTITMIAPTSGPTAGATPLTLTGTGYLSGATVSLGGTPATGVMVVSGTSITAISPSHAAGAVDVVVTNSDGQSATLSGGYTYTGTNPAPTIKSIAPATGSTTGNTAVTITGTGFLPGATVSLGGNSATAVTVVSTTSITATTPAHAAGSVDVVVTNTDGQSGTLPSGYTYTVPNPAPTVSTILPVSGPTTGGTPVAITGTGFLAGATVSIGGTPATGVTLVSATSITATTPAHAAGAVNVVVTNTDGQSGTLTNGYTYTTTTGGTISFVQVAAATPQTPSMTVTVTYPTAQTAGNLNIVVVGWDDTASSVNSVTDSAKNTYNLAVGPITGTGGRESIYYAKNIAPGSNTVTVAFTGAAVYPDIRVLEYSGLDTANPLDSTATAQAAGSTTSANSGSATTTSANELIFGAGKTAGRFTAAGTGFTSRIITSPDGDIAEDKIVAATGSYNATAPVTSTWVMQMAAFHASGQGTTNPAPTVSTITPTSGPTTGATPVTIMGTGFLAGATVSLGTTGATSVVVMNSTTITANTPAHAAGAVNVVVTNTDGQSSSPLTNGFTYTAVNPAPTVSSITPTSGPTTGATPVTIMGTGFLAGATVSLGTTAATSVVVMNSTTITANTPAHAAGAVNVVVTNTDGQSSSPLTNGFTYTAVNPAPTVSSITPTSGPTTGATPVTIMGTGFLAGATVSLGTTAATSVVVMNSTTITANTPAHAAGAVNVVVTNTDGQSSSPLTNGFTYTAVNPAPTVSSITPTSGPTTGATPVTIMGTGFLAGATVSLGTTAATSVVVMNSTTITANTPAHAAGAVNVVVTNTDGQSSSPLTNGFTYTTSTGGGPISFVQVATATPRTPTASVPVAYTVAQTAGNLNIVVVGWNDTTSTVTSVTDSNLNQYALAVGPTAGTGVQQSIYYAKNIAGGTNTVTVTFSKAAVFADVRTLEYSGVDTSSPVDVPAAVGASGTGSTANSGSATTATANDLIFGAGTTSGHFNGPGTGFTSRIITSPDGDIAEDKIVTSTGSYNATGAASYSNWVMQMVAFKAHP